MTKPKVDEAQYTKLVNEKMKEHELYKKDMGVELNPNNSSSPLGLTVVGGDDARTILSWAENEVRKKYRLVVTS
nr:hypothetical protein [uncultured Desulfobulbus sp.]